MAWQESAVQGLPSSHGTGSKRQVPVAVSHESAVQALSSLQVTGQLSDGRGPIDAFVP
jgi:hypothetical protein